jgi:peptidoglycan/xylan/chitin deacetylase (PgdA/CDA1 family)
MMQYSKNLHPASHLMKAVLGTLAFPFLGFPHQADDLLVLNLHSTPENSIGSLRALIHFLGRHFSLESPEFLERFYTAEGRNNNGKPTVVFTFDDGLRNNLHAARLLEEFGIRGLFFVVPDFFRAPEHEQEHYYRTYIRKDINPHYDTKPEDFRALSPEQLTELKSRGHVIGSHSMSHTMHHTNDAAKMEHEIAGSKRTLDELLQQNTEHFCAPFNSLQSVSADAMKQIKKQYRFFHSTFPGSNALERNSYFIKRVNIEAFWLTGAVKFACSGSEWNRWAPSSRAFQQISEKI